MKQQILIVHGGDTFESREEYLNFLRNYKLDLKWERYLDDRDDWKKPLRKELGQGYEVILPQMPNKFNATYEEWAIWFEKLFTFLRDGIILIGHSLGGSFLAKYLSENKFPRKIKAVMLVAAVFDKDCDGYSLLSFMPPEKLDFQTDNIYLYQSKDDHVVPISALEKYHQVFPNAKVRILDGLGHLNQERFPELIEDIKNLK